jgi:hypothetical protein
VWLVALLTLRGWVHDKSRLHLSAPGILIYTGPRHRLFLKMSDLLLTQPTLVLGVSVAHVGVEVTCGLWALSWARAHDLRMTVLPSPCRSVTLEAD